MEAVRLNSQDWKQTYTCGTYIWRVNSILFLEQTFCFETEQFYILSLSNTSSSSDGLAVLIQCHSVSTRGQACSQFVQSRSQIDLAKHSPRVHPWNALVRGRVDHVLCIFHCWENTKQGCGSVSGRLGLGLGECMSGTRRPGCSSLPRRCDPGPHPHVCSQSEETRHGLFRMCIELLTLHCQVWEELGLQRWVKYIPASVSFL